ncbi:MAG: hypothetical protein ACI9OU_002539 [Candidatus Promineifilaceae bacterium]|jgi:hypothetical protein
MKITMPVLTIALSIGVGQCITCQADTIRIGDTRSSVIDRWGVPTAEQQSSYGTLLLYTNMQVFLVKEAVVFLSHETAQPDFSGAPATMEESVAVPDSEADALKRRTSHVKNTAAPMSRTGSDPRPTPAHFDEHPMLVQAIQTKRDTMNAKTRDSMNLSTYWNKLRPQFARNSLFDQPGSMLRLKTADGRTIPAVGESPPPEWRYLDVDIDESFGTLNQVKEATSER